MVVTACLARHSKRWRSAVDAEGIEPVAGGVVGFMWAGSGGLSSTPRDRRILHDVGQYTVGGEPGRFRFIRETDAVTHDVCEDLLHKRRSDVVVPAQPSERFGRLEQTQTGSRRSAKG